jgi:hypothetical protein
MAEDKRIQEVEEEIARRAEAGKADLDGRHAEKARREDLEEAKRAIEAAAEAPVMGATRRAEVNGEVIETRSEADVFEGSVFQPHQAVEGEAPPDPERDYQDKNTPA